MHSVLKLVSLKSVDTRCCEPVFIKSINRNQITPHWRNIEHGHFEKARFCHGGLCAGVSDAASEPALISDCRCCRISCSCRSWSACNDGNRMLSNVVRHRLSKSPVKPKEGKIESQVHPHHQKKRRPSERIDSYQQITEGSSIENQH